MDSSPSKKQKSLIIAYSTLLILVLQLLFFKSSPQLYSIFNPLPFLIIGLAIKYSDFFKSCALAFLILILIHFFNENFLSKQLIFFHFLISLVTLFFLGSYQFSKKIGIDISNFLSGIIISFLFFFLSFIFLFFNDFEYEKLTSFLKIDRSNYFELRNTKK